MDPYNMPPGGPPVAGQMGSYPPHRSSPGPPIMQAGGKPRMVSARQIELIHFSFSLGHGYDGTASRNGP